MAYATIADVEKWMPARAPFLTNSKPSATMVAGIIGDVSAELDGLLAGQGYIVPITASQAATLMSAVVSRMAAAAVEQTAPTGSTPDSRKNYQAMSDSAVKALLAGHIQGAQRGESGDSGSVRSGPGTMASAMFVLEDPKRW